MGKETEPRADEAGTDYVVLRRGEDGSWVELPGVHRAESWQEAVKMATPGEQPNMHAEGTYKGVSLRAWKGVMTIGVETRPTFAEAEDQQALPLRAVEPPAAAES